ncbi:fibronectin type III domain-containing protein [Chryseobacterium sp. MYb264]|uniref:fibronectin type III domain-containing protein n=1 Tax=Chryseobacterium sp. MYb264 TaxID=2745153 RepID=UPI002E149A26|nr:fibronectin type III domain-containing protein [Chryseobacterium sp. MYb264]
MKQKLLILLITFLNITVFSQIAVNEGFENNSVPNGWVYSRFEQLNSAGIACTGTGAISGNVYGVSLPTSASSVEFNSNNSNGQIINISFKYKAEATNPSNSIVTGNVKVEYSFDNGSTYYLVGSTINLTSPINTCTNFTGTIPANTSSLNSNLKFRITARNENAGDWKLIIDDVVLSQTLSCVDPTNTSVSNIQTNSAKINWSSTSIPSNGFDIYYSTSSTSPTSATVPLLIGVQGTSVILNSLQQATYYYVWIRSNCSSQVNQWVLVSGTAFRTLCGSWDLPYFENFNSIIPGDMPACHLRENLAGGAWWVSAIKSQNYGSGNAIGIGDYGRWFFTKALNLHAGVTYILKYNRPTNRINSKMRLKIAYGLSQNWSAMTNILKQETVPYNADSGQEILYFTPTQSAVYYLGFYGSKSSDGSTTGFSDVLFLDDISLNVATNCRTVENLSVSSITSTSATIEWVAPSIIPSLGYDVYYSTDNAYPSNSIVPNYQGVTNLSQDLNALEPGEKYFVWVRSRCSSTEFSDWKRVPFSTACSPYVATPYLENFENSFIGELPNCTSMEYILPQVGYEQAEVNYINKVEWPSKVFAGSSNFNLNSWFFTKGIYLESGRQYKMAYLYGASYSSSYTNLRLKVAFGNLPNSASMTNIINDYPNNLPALSNSAEHLFSVSTTGIYYFGFNAIKNNSSDNRLILDNISIIDNGVLAVNDIDRKNDISVFPNPFDNNLFISNITDVKSIEIKDVSGRLIKILSVTKEIHLDTLNSGIYFISLKYKDGSTKTFKTVKK